MPANKPPFDGEWVRLKGRVEYVRGVTYKAAVDLHEELDRGSYILLRANNIQDGRLSFDDVQYVDKSKVKPKQLLRKGDILICASSGSKSLVGKAALVENDMPITFGAFCCVLRPKTGESEYLGHYFQSRQYRKAIERACSGSNINNLKAASFESLIVPLYSKTDMLSVVGVLDALVAQKRGTESQLELLDTLVKSRFVEMFGGSGWPVVTVGSLATDIRYGTSKKASDSGQFVYLRMNNMTDGGGLDFDDVKYIDLDGSELDKCLVVDGDLLFNRTNSREKVGKTAVFHEKEPMVIAGYIIRVRLGDRIRPDFLAAYMNLPTTKAMLRSIARGAVHQANINSKELSAIEVPVPPICLQDSFLAFVAEVDKSRFIVQQKIEKLQTLYDSLAQKYFG